MEKVKVYVLASPAYRQVGSWII